MPDATASSADGSMAIDPADRSKESDPRDPSREVDSKDRSQDGDSPGRSQVVEVACPHCDRPTTVPVSDARAELHVRPYVAAFGEYSTAHCADGHEFWIYYC